MKCSCLQIVLLACLTVLAVPVQATVIDIANPGFDVDPAGYNLGATGWTSTYGGTFNLNLTPVSSPNYFFLPGGTGCGVSQLLQVGGSALHVQAGDQITFTVSEGLRDNSPSSPVADMALRLWTGAVGTGTKQQAFYTDFPSLGGWLTRTATFTAAAGDVGQNLYLEFYAPGYNTAQLCLDNVSASFTAVPEPSVLALTATAMVGLLAYAWRKRK